MKGDPCQIQACAIQKCLQVHNYKEAACPKEFQEMRKCCEKWAELSGCCSGFKESYSNKTEEQHTNQANKSVPIGK